MFFNGEHKYIYLNMYISNGERNYCLKSENVTSNWCSQYILFIYLIWLHIDFFTLKMYWDFIHIKTYILLQIIKIKVKLIIRK